MYVLTFCFGYILAAQGFPFIRQILKLILSPSCLFCDHSDQCLLNQLPCATGGNMKNSLGTLSYLRGFFSFLSGGLSLLEVVYNIYAVFVISVR